MPENSPMVYAGLFPEMTSIHGLSDNSRLAWTANTESIAAYTHSPYCVMRPAINIIPDLWLRRSGPDAGRQRHTATTATRCATCATTTSVPTKDKARAETTSHSQTNSKSNRKQRPSVRKRNSKARAATAMPTAPEKIQIPAEPAIPPAAPLSSTAFYVPLSSPFPYILSQLPRQECSWRTLRPCWPRGLSADTRHSTFPPRQPTAEVGQSRAPAPQEAKLK